MEPEIFLGFGAKIIKAYSQDGVWFTWSEELTDTKIY